MDELRLTGNCLKGSRPLLSFDKTFDSAPHLKLLKELFTQVLTKSFSGSSSVITKLSVLLLHFCSQVFHVPHKHPKSQPFHDHVMGFYVVDNKIWIRHYQIADESTDKKTREKMIAKGEEPTSLVEIGPRFVCDIIRVFAGAFGGPTIYFNQNYVSPNKVRHDMRYAEAKHKEERTHSRIKRMERAEKLVVPRSEVDTVFGEGGDRRDFEEAATVIGYGGGGGSDSKGDKKKKGTPSKNSAAGGSEGTTAEASSSADDDDNAHSDSSSSDE